MTPAASSFGFGAIARRWRLSLWLAIGSIVLTALMMHPSFASLLVAGVNAGLLFLLRFAAHREGRAP